MPKRKTGGYGDLKQLSNPREVWTVGDAVCRSQSVPSVSWIQYVELDALWLFKVPRNDERRLRDDKTCPKMTTTNGPRGKLFPFPPQKSGPSTPPSCCLSLSLSHTLRKRRLRTPQAQPSIRPGGVAKIGLREMIASGIYHMTRKMGTRVRSVGKGEALPEADVPRDRRGGGGCEAPFGSNRFGVGEKRETTILGVETTRAMR